ncbi:MAG: hypothetical protein U1F55_05615 [Chitinivorax sp.]
MPAPKNWQPSAVCCELVKFFFLLTFAAAIPAIISGIAERAKFHPQSIATFVLVGFLYLLRRHCLESPPGPAGLAESQQRLIHDFAGSVVVHAVGSWIALAAVMLAASWSLYQKVAWSQHLLRHPDLPAGCWVVDWLVRL